MESNLIDRVMIKNSTFRKVVDSPDLWPQSANKGNAVIIMTCHISQDWALNYLHFGDFDLFHDLDLWPDRSQNRINWSPENKQSSHQISCDSVQYFLSSAKDLACLWSLTFDLWPDRSENLINWSPDNKQSSHQISCDSVQYFLSFANNTHTNK